MEKLNEVVKFLQSKQAVLSVNEINTICTILQEQIEVLKNAKEKTKPNKGE